jgi:hypothetical protein
MNIENQFSNMQLDDDSILGVAIETIGIQPINGLRHLPAKGTSGWYVWCGKELSKQDDFFKPICLRHVKEKLPQIVKYLKMKPGTRFQIDNNGYEDIWNDPDIIHE